MRTKTFPMLAVESAKSGLDDASGTPTPSAICTLHLASGGSPARTAFSRLCSSSTDKTLPMMAQGQGWSNAFGRRARTHER